MWGAVNLLLLAVISPQNTCGEGCPVAFLRRESLAARVKGRLFKCPRDADTWFEKQ